MSDAIIGHTGFVGSYLKTKIYDNCDLYNSKNIELIQNKSYKIAYVCGLPATKWLINQNPEEDYKNMLELQRNLLLANIEKIILISTIDIYSKTNQNQNEDDNDITEEPYGHHRYLMEEWVKQNYIDYHIIRLPGIFGLGLKKNIIFDLLNNHNLDKINIGNKYQWYYLDDLYNDIKQILNQNIRIINLFSESIKVSELISCFDIKYNFKNNTELIYDYKTKYITFLKSKEYIITKLKEYIEIYNNVNNLVVSNLSWSNESVALDILKRYGINKLELAITKYFNWDNIDIDAIKSKGFEIYSMQALFYGVKYNLFINKTEFINHFKKVISIAKQLNVKKLVFGSPNNRYIPIDFDKDPVQYFIDVMNEIIIDIDVDICIEPNAVQYGCNFINTISEAIDIIIKINNPRVKLNLDTGNAMMMNDELTNLLVGHVQISAPYLGGIIDCNFPRYDYKKYIRSLEMKEIPIELFENNIRRFCLL
jgi:nucleoside-diphosphate-sugar epimerase